MELMDYYDINYRKVMKINEDYLVALPKTNLILKKINKSEAELTAALAIVDYVRKSGFSNLISIRHNREGKAFTKLEGKVYVLIEVFQGEKIKFYDVEDVTYFTMTLAEFHQAAEGYKQSPGIQTKVLWGKRMEQYRTCLMKVEKFAKDIKLKEELDVFEKVAIIFIDSLVERCRQSCKILKSIDYLKALEDSMLSREISFNSVSKNSITLFNKRIMLMNPFNCAYNMVEEDIAQIVKRSIEETEEKGMLEYIISTYNSVKPLRDSSEKIIKALVSYPIDSVKTILKYLKAPEAAESYIEKFEDYVKREELSNLLGG